MYHVGYGTGGGQRYYRDVLIDVLYVPDYVQPVQVGHVHIGYHQVEFFLLEGFDGVAAVDLGRHAMPFGF